MPRQDTTPAKGLSWSSGMNRIKVKAPARRSAPQSFPAQLFWTVSPGFVVNSLHNAVPQKELDFMPTTVFNYLCIGNRWYITTFCFVSIARVLVLTNFVLQCQSVSFLKVLHLLTVKNKQTNMLFLLSFQFIFKVRTLGSLSLAWVGEGSGVSLFTWAQKYRRA